MESLRGLDHYRALVAGDPITFRLLSYLYHNGPTADGDLGDKDLLRTSLHRRLAELFRANLVRRTLDSRWSTTDLANLALARMGIANRSTTWLIDAWGLPKEDALFLKSCVQTPEEQNPRVALLRQALVKSLCFIRGNLSESEATNTDMHTALFSVILGLDPRVEALGVDAFARALDTPNLKGSAFGSLRQKILRAIDETRASTRCLILRHEIVESPALALTWARLVSAASTGIVDYALKPLSDSTSDHLPTIWETLVSWKPDLNVISHLFFQHVWHTNFDPPTDPSKTLEFLGSRMAAIHQESYQAHLRSEVFAPPVYSSTHPLTSDTQHGFEQVQEFEHESGLVEGIGYKSGHLVRYTSAEAGSSPFEYEPITIAEALHWWAELQSDQTANSRACARDARARFLHHAAQATSAGRDTRLAQ